jgi:signal transduction histidine kinase
VITAPSEGTGPPRLRLPGGHENRWVVLFLTVRAIALVTAVMLLSVHQVTPDRDETLVIVGTLYTLLSGLVLYRWTEIGTRPVTWGIDIAVMLGLVIATDDWRSPYYLLALTALALPATQAPFNRALLWGAVFWTAYLVTSFITGPDPRTLGTTTSVETFALHAMLPGLVTFALAYAAEVLRRLNDERERSERLAIETERKRIAWELHDSAKQRLHAANLVLGSVQERVAPELIGAVEQAVVELRGAMADMDTSLSELRSPLEGRPLHEALSDRADALRVDGRPEIEVTGKVPPLPPLHAVHTFRIAAEAMSNAVRHADPKHVQVRLETRNGTLTVTVSDDGRGMPEAVRPGSTGLLAMHSRAQTIGGQVEVQPGPSGRGTSVRLELPLNELNGGTP